MKRRHSVGIAVIVLFIVFCGFTFSQSLTPYVSFNTAKEKGGAAQVKGELAGGVERLAGGAGVSFVLRDDEGTTVRVVYPGIEPENMEHAESVVVVGQYAGQDFHAEQILVKCPSKYQAEEVS